MSDISVNLGDIYFLHTPPNGSHYSIPIAKTSQRKYLFVSVSTRRKKSDTSCILTPGHEIPGLIQDESIIQYKYAREMDINDLCSLSPGGIPDVKDSCSSELLERIQQGGLESKQLKHCLKNLLRNFLNQ